MARNLISNLEGSLDPSSIESRGKKRRKIGVVEAGRNQTVRNGIRWRSETEQRIYTTKLIDALRKVRESSSPVAKVSNGSRGVKEAADRVLATAARGTTRWSRAILMPRLRLKKTLQKSRKARVTGNKRLKKVEVKRARTKSPAVQEKVQVLSRLVPGCRKASLPNLLEETGDYIAALEMQVRAMAALTELLSGSPANRLGSN